MGKISIISIIILLLVSTYTVAEPSKPIANFIKTPASAFDMYLFRLYEQSKCRKGGWFISEPNNKEPNVCMPTPIEYSYEDNIIEIPVSPGETGSSSTILVVTGTTRFTRQPANYWVQITEK